MGDKKHHHEQVMDELERMGPGITALMNLAFCFSRTGHADVSQELLNIADNLQDVKTTIIRIEHDHSDGLGPCPCPSQEKRRCPA